MSRRGKVLLVAVTLAICACAPWLQSRLLRSQREDRPAVLYAVVRAQWSALRAQNFPSAYRFASSAFQERCNVEQFMQTASGDLEALTQAVRVEFGAVVFSEDRAFVQVFFTSPRGQIRPCLYTLVHEMETWKVEAAELSRSLPDGARVGSIEI